jgi:hypothetical protein
MKRKKYKKIEVSGKEDVNVETNARFKGRDRGTGGETDLCSGCNLVPMLPIEHHGRLHPLHKLFPPSFLLLMPKFGKKY